MAKTFKLEIVTPERVVYSESVSSLVAPGIHGYVGILADHAPLMAELTIGEISVTDAQGQEQHIATAGGFMQVSENAVRILADTAEFGHEIDVDRAQQSVQRAQDRLRKSEGVDHTRAQVSLLRAMNRLRVARGQ